MILNQLLKALKLSFSKNSCASSCLVDEYVNVEDGNSFCLKCIDSMENCTKCTNANTCS